MERARSVAGASCLSAGTNPAVTCTVRSTGSSTLVKWKRATWISSECALNGGEIPQMASVYRLKVRLGGSFVNREAAARSLSRPAALLQLCLKSSAKALVRVLLLQVRNAGAEAALGERVEPALVGHLEMDEPSHVALEHSCITSGAIRLFRC
jgi:hypothetical protein